MNKSPEQSSAPVLQQAELSWQEDGAPFSAQYGDVYFSRNGGLAETHHVFLEANALQQRWLELDQLENPGVFTIAELGFGTGLNFLSCWRLWQQTACKRLRLHFISCEKHPMSQPALQRALQQWPELAGFSSQMIEQYPDHSPGYHRLLLNHTDSGSAVTLDLYYGDALDMLQQQSSPTARIDAWFLDGFTPGLNPDLWSEEILHTISHYCRSGSTLSSYSVTGRVVRSLRSLGFHVEKRAGFGPKRHMLFATYKPEEQNANQAATTRSHKTAIVIGSGLAGATIARSLAQRGVAVTVLEQAEHIASGASGNKQAVVQLRLNRQTDANWQFHLHSYLYALRFYQNLAATDPENSFHWHACGVLTLNSAYSNTRDAADSLTLAHTYKHYPEAVLQAANAEQAASLTGLEISEDGLWQPAGGWMNPHLCCERCLSHERIQVRTLSRATALEPNNNRWTVNIETVGEDKSTHQLHADIVIIANSYFATGFEQTALYPVSPLRGQVSHVPANSISSQLQQIVCSQRYLAPAGPDGEHCVGASYIKNSTDTSLSTDEHRENLQKLGELASLMELSSDLPLAGRAGIRGASLDYTPIAGQVPDPDLPELRYGGAQHLPDAASDIRHLPGLYISTGHGSHGTASCPLIAEHLAALICDEASPLPQALAEVIDPVRFIHRQRRRARSQHQNRN